MAALLHQPLPIRILVVEDTADLAEAIGENLEAEEFQVRLAFTGGEAVAALEASPADILVLDLTLPDMDGFDLLRSLRQRHDTTPVLILTARTEQEDRLQGFSFGADDYLAKPFAMPELVARIKAIIRRCRPETRQPRILATGPFKLNLLHLTVTRGRAKLNLTNREFRILEVLVSQAGRVHSRQELINLAWERGAQPLQRAVDVHITSLRRKLMETDQFPLIQTLEREGYRWLLPVKGVSY